MRQWDYTSNPRWLEARKGLLTATEMVSLVIPYREWKNSEEKAANGDKRCNPESKKKEFVSACRKLWAEKLAEWHAPKTDTPEMRRGHCLEKTCVDEINQYFNGMAGAPYFYHWDDVVVKNGNWGCSPDALDVPMPEQAVADCICDINDIAPKHALEIKSFNDNDHMAEYMLEDKWKIDEVRKNAKKDSSIITQVAAQIISLGLESCTVVFYNPAIPKYGIKMFTFYASDFAADAKLLPAIVEEYEKLVAEFETINVSAVTIHTTEQELYYNWLGGNEGDSDIRSVGASF